MGFVMPIERRALERGKQEEARALVMRLLRRRLGAVDSQAEELIRQLSREQLEALGEALLDFTEATDLTAWLENRGN